MFWGAKVVEKIRTHILRSVTPPPPEIVPFMRMWENMVDPDTSQ
jgi:hypothetical protein